MEAKLGTSGLDVIQEVDQDGWHGTFYYSSDPIPGSITWIETYKSYFEDRDTPKNRNYYAAFVLQRGATCYVLSYGKAHFYLRPFCEYDFGVDLAKRIADEGDIKQTASKRFQGKKKKDIKSYTNNTRLDVESGESVDYLQAALIASRQARFGKSGKFGTSALISPDIILAELGAFLSDLEAEMVKPARFKLPRTTVITDPVEVARFDELLVAELKSRIGVTEFTRNSYDLYGVDFVFSNDGSFKLRCPGYPIEELQDLAVKDLKNYITRNGVVDVDILKIKVTHQQDDRPKYTQPIKEAEDFISDSERVLLSGGRWMRFNQDYLEYLDEYISEITVEEVEDGLQDIIITETDFNVSDEVARAGYEVADKDFSIFRTRASTPIEAWDLRRLDTVYAVKFGTAQKLGYVCDQATVVLELLRNRAEVKEIPNFSRYCLWFGYRGKTMLGNISESGSIILKQKIETWARKARDLGIEPVIKVSRKLKQGVDVDVPE